MLGVQDHGQRSCTCPWPDSDSPPPLPIGMYVSTFEFRNMTVGNDPAHLNLRHFRRSLLFFQYNFYSTPPSLLHPIYCVCFSVTPLHVFSSTECQKCLEYSYLGRENQGPPPAISLIWQVGSISIQGLERDISYAWRIRLLYLLNIAEDAECQKGFA